MTDAPADRPESPGLFLDWDDLRALVSPRIGRERFRALIKRKVLAAGFPPFRDEWGGFYQPAVRAWLDNDQRVTTDEPVAADVQDGQENFDAAPGKKARVQNRPPQPAVLDSGAGVPRPDGVSRHLHSVAGGRER